MFNILKHYIDIQPGSITYNQLHHRMKLCLLFPHTFVSYLMSKTEHSSCETKYFIGNYNYLKGKYQMMRCDCKILHISAKNNNARF